MTEIPAHLGSRPTVVRLRVRHDRWTRPRRAGSPRELMPPPLVPLGRSESAPSVEATSVPADGPAVVLWEVAANRAGRGLRSSGSNRVRRPRVLQLVAGPRSLPIENESCCRSSGVPRSFGIPRICPAWP